MVCRHCVESVKQILSNEMGLSVRHVELGSAEIEQTLSKADLKRLSNALQREGFELIQSREAKIVDEIKCRLIEYSREELSGRMSMVNILSEKFNLSYNTMSRIFSEVEGRSIENYYMNLRIERVKELIKYQQLSLSEIADMMGYSSVAHLSRQFKQFTGLTPSQFREIGIRKSLSEV